MARRVKITERSADDIDLKPPPQVYSNVIWGYRAGDGWFIPDPPTRDELLKHAERFGTDQVAETAAECGYGLEEMIALIERLDQIDVMRAKKEGFKFGAKQKRSTPEKRAKKILNWVEPEKDVEEESDAA